MEWCLLCNGLDNVTLECRKCGGEMEDQGREYDFYDDYSPYMEIDLMKLVDGDPASSKKSECTHLFKCNQCGNQAQKEIKYQ